MARRQKGGGGGKGTRKYGRNKETCLRYRNEDRRFKNKLKKVLKSNGKRAAKIYEDFYVLHKTTSGVSFKEKK